MKGPREVIVICRGQCSCLLSLTSLNGVLLVCVGHSELHIVTWSGVTLELKLRFWQVHNFPCQKCGKIRMHMESTLVSCLETRVNRRTD